MHNPIIKSEKAGQLATLNERRRKVWPPSPRETLFGSASPPPSMSLLSKEKVDPLPPNKLQSVAPFHAWTRTSAAAAEKRRKKEKERRQKKRKRRKWRKVTVYYTGRRLIVGRRRRRKGESSYFCPIYDQTCSLCICPSVA
jgi:hypothetical protein